MKRTRREVLKDTLKVWAAAMTAPRPLLAAAAAASKGGRNLALNRAAWASSAVDFIQTGHMATDGQTKTQWASKGAGEEWVYVDLGALCDVNRVVLQWGKGFARVYKIQVSTERKASPETGLVETWADVYGTGNGKGAVEEIALKSMKARFVRLLCNEAAQPEGYSLRGFEVYGEGGPQVQAMPVPAPRADGTLELGGGWKLVSEEFVAGEAAKISLCGYNDAAWLPATVPGTVLTSYLNAGAVPDMFYGDDQFQVSDWFARCRWWYRNELTVPAGYKGKRIWLNLDGINYKADIYVNGAHVGKMAGAFMLGRFDITDKVTPGKKNCIAVLIHPVTYPCEPTVKRLDKYVWPEAFTRNAPTFLESAGWDWLATIRDRNIGIWNKVSLTTSGEVTIHDPFVITDLPLLPELSRADLTLKVELKNHSAERRTGALHVEIGAARFSHSVTLDAGETKSLTLDKQAHAELSLKEPRLWWPNGYGEQHLYAMTLRFEMEGRECDVNRSQVGVRKLTYNQSFKAIRDVGKTINIGGSRIDDPNTKPLIISCNGQPIFLRGADWGMDEGMLRCDAEGYETRLRYEKEMHYTILRNCLGNVAKQEFYEICDQYGLFVWEEFGLNHSSMPYDINLWLENLRCRLRAKRNHACVALYCSANEGATEEPLRSTVGGIVDELDGTRLFLQHSTQHPPIDVEGPYDQHLPTFYFETDARGFCPEIASPTVPPVESMRRMMPHNKLWPINEMWGTHDWWKGKSGFCDPTEAAVACYGEAAGIEDFCRKAAMVNMEGFKAIYEAWNHKMWDTCSGVMIWMSDPCWPSLTWNTYDYYFEPTASYFGIRKACEPVHIQWSMATNEVKVVNCTLKALVGVRAEAQVVNLDGSPHLQKSATLDCAANSAHPVFNLFAGDDPKSPRLSEVYFIRLELKDAEGKRLSENFYWNGKEVWKYLPLAAMDRVEVNGTVKTTQEGGRRRHVVNVTSGEKGVALMVRLKVVDAATDLLVAPVLYSENYFSLLPGESRRVDVEYPASKAASKDVKVLVEGWNVVPKELRMA